MISIGDVFFNGMYPYIDPGTGDSIDGMIAAADKILSLADSAQSVQLRRSCLQFTSTKADHMSK